MPPQPPLLPAIDAFLAARSSELDRIRPARRSVLEPLADHVRDRTGEGRVPRVVFVCTHNSRRSHLAQLWFAASCHRCDIAVETYSGGTEATSFDHRAAAALARAGFELESRSADPEGALLVRMSPDLEPSRCFSKIHDQPPNPTSGFVAVMVCDEADRACPLLPGAEARLPIRFEDPKQADGTPSESMVYDQRCREIAREMLWIAETARDR